ncbi:TetR/AcrR family transcriptional regulator [Nocardia terpenica]|uniref:TetR family transcriptional regulator n=1 Tax=Nocardia terpenica TaxID=455432 RepID=A0A164MAV1_9NOCA|nr:TetR/AcrR family transcriptional regulator [Nocardia terpenica]KZM73199.1 TetR family transcriptional regulator [Nocardia terpenica]MBF6064211.1 TetR/AcrR family transcriptional regulator [Nocardia terpenica]MBF6106544.1 TetR/AcrR family transcriptional regulator [Nocardia terpenica]MBF6113829.1 TetR/AcrR family transcriptional regulator [Nocardia terpenica]MBF6120547.1 TetR/AcrR family transcriptional regulator [Nocardia terpenica]
MSEAASPARPPATGKGARRRAELLDVAERILVDAGHGELTMRAVATAAGVRLGHLQYYFPNRADLVAAVLHRALGQSMHRLGPLLESAAAQPAPALIRTLLTEQDDPRMVRIYTELWALAGRDETVATAVRDFYRTYQAHVAGVIAARNPGLSERECRVRARVFAVVIEGAALFRSGIADAADAETDAALIETAAALLDP